MGATKAAGSPADWSDFKIPNIFFFCFMGGGIVTRAGFVIDFLCRPGPGVTRFARDPPRVIVNGNRRAARGTKTHSRRDEKIVVVVVYCRR